MNQLVTCPKCMRLYDSVNRRNTCPHPMVFIPAPGLPTIPAAVPSGRGPGGNRHNQREIDALLAAAIVYAVEVEKFARVEDAWNEAVHTTGQPWPDPLPPAPDLGPIQDARDDLHNAALAYRDTLR